MKSLRIAKLSALQPAYRALLSIASLRKLSVALFGTHDQTSRVNYSSESLDQAKSNLRKVGITSSVLGKGLEEIEEQEVVGPRQWVSKDSDAYDKGLDLLMERLDQIISARHDDNDDNNSLRGSLNSGLGDSRETESISSSQLQELGSTPSSSPDLRRDHPEEDEIVASNNCKCHGPAAIASGAGRFGSRSCCSSSTDCYSASSLCSQDPGQDHSRNSAGSSSTVATRSSDSISSLLSNPTTAFMAMIVVDPGGTATAHAFTRKSTNGTHSNASPAVPTQMTKLDLLTEMRKLKSFLLSEITKSRCREEKLREELATTSGCRDAVKDILQQLQPKVGKNESQSAAGSWSRSHTNTTSQRSTKTAAGGKGLFANAFILNSKHARFVQQRSVSPKPSSYEHRNLHDQHGKPSGAACAPSSFFSLRNLSKCKD